MKWNYLLVLVMLACIINITNAQQLTNERNTAGTKENPKEIQVAKNKVVVELKKTTDKDGNTVVVAEEVERTMIPESFPKYIDTGNPKEDEAAYYEAKQKWIREYPDEYEKIKHLNL
ncbi:MAG: hypothetical protein ABIJ16_00990 [Bacteroidota bacterium]